MDCVSAKNAIPVKVFSVLLVLNCPVALSGMFFRSTGSDDFHVVFDSYKNNVVNGCCQ